MDDNASGGLNFTFSGCILSYVDTRYMYPWGIGSTYHYFRAHRTMEGYI